MKAKKIILYAILLSFIYAGLISGQEEKENTFRWFRGGSVDVNFSLQTDLFYGIGGKFSNSCVSLKKDVSSIYWNPAQLSFLPYRQVELDFIPPFSLNVGDYYDVESEVEASINNAIADYKTSETTGNIQR